MASATSPNYAARMAAARRRAGKRTAEMAREDGRHVTWVKKRKTPNGELLRDHHAEKLFWEELAQALGWTINGKNGDGWHNKEWCSYSTDGISGDLLTITFRQRNDIIRAITKAGLR